MNNPKKSRVLAGLLDRLVLWKPVFQRPLIKCCTYVVEDSQTQKSAECLYEENYKGFSATSIGDAHKKGFILGVKSARGANSGS